MARALASGSAMVVFFAVLLSGEHQARPSQVPDDVTWRIDPAHSQVIFTVTKWGFVEVEGRFFDFGGTVAYDEVHPERSQVDWHVKVASVRTGADNRDKALQDVEYFDAARYPEMRFVSDTVRAISPGVVEVAGRLTIRGVTRPLVVRAAVLGRQTVPGEGRFELFQTEFTLNRYDFGVVGGSILGPAISKDVRVRLTLAAQPDRP
jgi:polyisoprenoid-binding protein YceI